jgi:hypothetical protein
MNEKTPLAIDEKNSEDLQSEYLLLRESLAALENEMKGALEEKCIEDITTQLKS